MENEKEKKKILREIFEGGFFRVTNLPRAKFGGGVDLEWPLRGTRREEMRGGGRQRLVSTGSVSHKTLTRS